jgi:hypothetical protein
MTVPPSSAPYGKVSTGVATIAPESGEMRTATVSGLAASAVGPPALEAAGLGWPAAVGDAAAVGAGVGAAAVGAGLGTTAGTGDGMTSIAIGEGDGGSGEGTGAGTKASWVPVPSMCDWMAPAATTPPIASTAKMAGKRKRSVSFGRIRGHFSGISTRDGSLAP